MSEELNYTTRCFFHSIFNNAIIDFQTYGFVNLFIDDHQKKWHFEDSLLAVFETSDYYHSSTFFHHLISFPNASQYYTVEEDEHYFMVVVFKMSPMLQESLKNFKLGKWFLVENDIKEQCLKTGKVLPDESTPEIISNEIFRFR